MTTFVADWRAGTYSGGADVRLPAESKVAVSVNADSYEARNRAVTLLRAMIDTTVDVYGGVTYGRLPFGVVSGDLKVDTSARDLLRECYNAAPGEVWEARVIVSSTENAFQTGVRALSEAIGTAADGVGSAAESLAEIPGRAVARAFDVPTWVKTLIYVVTIGALIIGGIYVVKVLPQAIKSLASVAKVG